MWLVVNDQLRLMYIAVAGRQMQNSMSMLYATQLLRTASENTKRYQSNEISLNHSRWAEITKDFICYHDLKVE